MRETNDGFKIAEEDLRIRGPGDVLGTRQTGDISFRIADVIRDAYLLDYVREVGAHIRQSRQAVIEPIINRWLENAERYSNV